MLASRWENYQTRAILDEAYLDRAFAAPGSQQPLVRLSQSGQTLDESSEPADVAAAMGAAAMAGNSVELSELLKYVSSELLKADKSARDNQQAVMAFDQCTLELAVTAEKQKGGGIKVWILNLSAGTKKSDSHTITITMKALSDRLTVAPGQAENIPINKKHGRQTSPR